jgi:hypothetical protein
MNLAETRPLQDIDWKFSRTDRILRKFVRLPCGRR